MQERHATPQDVLAATLTNNSDLSAKAEANRRANNKPKATDWRFGPAQLWYDMIDVPVDAESCNYGFKLEPEVETFLGICYLTSPRVGSRNR